MGLIEFSAGWTTLDGAACLHALTTLPLRAACRAFPHCHHLPHCLLPAACYQLTHHRLQPAPCHTCHAMPPPPAVIGQWWVGVVVEFDGSGRYSVGCIIIVWEVLGARSIQLLGN